jgi:biopolymer transport protein ExbD
MSQFFKPGGMKKKQGALNLNITSMMDMFTIILVFLLFSYSIEDSNVTIAEGLRLPDSVSVKPYREAVTISLSKNDLRVQGDIVLELKNGDLPKGSTKNLKIRALYDALLKAKEEREANKKEEGTVPEDSLVLVQADRSASYKTIDPILKTAGMAGFPNFRFAVMRVK